MCMIDDGDSAAVYSMQIRKAKKEHKCEECNRKINAGEKYRYVFGVWGGDARAFKTCAHCSVAMDLLERECNGFMHGGIYEDISEHVSWDVPWRMTAARIKIGMQRKWKRFKSDQLMGLVDI